MKRASVVVLAALPAFAVACGSFQEAATGPDIVDGGPGSGDGNVIDAGPSGDATGDAPALLDGGSAFCATLVPAPTHCSDFEVLPPTWTMRVMNGGTVTITPAPDARSGASVLETRGFGADDARSAIGPEIDEAVTVLSRVEIGAQVFVEPFTANRDLDLISFVLRNDMGVAYTLDVELDASGAFYIEETRPNLGNASTAAAKTFTFRQWTSVVLEVTFNGAESVAVLKLDGVPVATRPALAIAQMQNADVVWFGEPDNQYTTWHARYDDAYVTVTKK